MLDAVEKATRDSPGPAPRDLNDAFLGAAYGRAYRCVRSIRELACRGEADDALILTRSLLLTVAQALYLVEPGDPAERERRLASARRSWAREALRTLNDLAATGFEPDDDRERIAGIEEAEKARGVSYLPTDRDLLSGLGLSVYYASVYRFASDVVHYSIGSALVGFLEDPDPVLGGGRVPLKNPDGERAEEALTLAAITYGEFLERCEPIIRHGVSEWAQREMADHFKDRRLAERAGGTRELLLIETGEARPHHQAIPNGSTGAGLSARQGTRSRCRVASTLMEPEPFTWLTATLTEERVQ